MYNGLVHLHSTLRWVIILLLLWNIIKLFGCTNSIKQSKWLLISSHIMLLLGLYQYFFGKFGFALFKEYGAEVMKTASLRFWAVEHITGMIVAIALITVGHISLKKSGNTKKTALLYLVAFILIMLMVPWPFREAIGRSWFPGMS